MSEYIERGAVCEALDDVIKGYIADKTFQGNFAAGILCDFRDTMLAKISAADVVEVKHGRWDEIDNYTYDCVMGLTLNCPTYLCSVCGEQTVKNFHYCPNCGARMDGGKDNG